MLSLYLASCFTNFFASPVFILVCVSTIHSLFLPMLVLILPMYMLGPLKSRLSYCEIRFDETC